MTALHDTVPPSSSVPAVAKKRILYVEDDADIARMLTDVLRENGFDPSFVSSATEMDTALNRDSVDLVVLDIMLPGEDGLSICRRLRATSSIPIIMVTARGEDIDRILGLEIGADDYVSKPFNPRELIARIRAILRRTSPAATTAGPLVLGDLRLDPRARDVWLNDMPLNLT